MYDSSYDVVGTSSFTELAHQMRTMHQRGVFLAQKIQAVVLHLAPSVQNGSLADFINSNFDQYNRIAHWIVMKTHQIYALIFFCSFFVSNHTFAKDENYELSDAFVKALEVNGMSVSEISLFESVDAGWTAIAISDSEGVVRFEVRIKVFPDSSIASNRFLKEVATVPSGGSTPFPLIADEIRGFPSAILVRNDNVVFWVVHRINRSIDDPLFRKLSEDVFRFSKSILK